MTLNDCHDILPDYIMDLNLIVLMEFGSHLYGTANEESDLDFAGIYLPTREQILLNKIPKCVLYKTKKKGEEKNTALDVDCGVYSLHYFLKLAAEGQTAALDMLHAPFEWPIIADCIWDDLVLNREMFYTKSLKAFVGYARKQAAKYGVKGTRLNAAREVVDFLFTTEGRRLADVWDDLPRGEHVHDDLVDPKGARIYQVCGKKFQETAACDYVRNIMGSFVSIYGERARKASANEGIDWKAVSHAIRAATQTLDLLTHGRFSFPLGNAAFVQAVKEGKYDFKRVVQPYLETAMAACEHASELSNFPQVTDQAAVDKWLIETLERQDFLRRHK